MEAKIYRKSKIHNILNILILILMMFIAAANGQAVKSDAPLLLVVLMDTSGSMQRSDPAGATQEAVYTAMNLIIHENPAVCLVEFSNQANILVEPTNLTFETLASIRQKIAAQQADGTTHLDSGLKGSIEKIQLAQFENYRKAIVILSDGEVPAEQYAEIERLGNELGLKGIAIYSIGLKVERGKNNILEILANKSGGEFFAVRGGTDLLEDSRMAAIETAVKLMSNNIYAYSDGQSSINIPREAQKIVAMVPNGVKLQGPADVLCDGTSSFASSIQVTETRYANWKVIVMRRPANETDIQKLWQGGWFAIDENGKRSKVWALMQTDISINAETIEPNPTAEQHIRMSSKLALSSSAITPKNPYSLRAYLKPVNGPAYNKVEEPINGEITRTTELELPPVDFPGDYELVCQVLNAANIVAAENRQPVKIEPSHFRLIVSVVSPDKSKRVILASDNGKKMIDPVLKKGETINIEIIPVTPDANQEIELLTGGITLEGPDKKAVTYKLEVDRSGPTPKLYISGLQIDSPTEIKIDARKQVRAKSISPIGTPIYSTEDIGAHWSFDLKPAYSAPITDVQIIAKFQKPEVIQKGQRSVLTFNLTAAGMTMPIRTRILQLAADKVQLRMTGPDGREIFIPFKEQIERQRIGLTQNSDDTSTLAVGWNFIASEHGEYLTGVYINDQNSLSIEGVPVFFVSETGRFEVSKPWILANIKRVNRACDVIPMRDVVTLLDGDEGVFEIVPTDEMSARLIDYVQVNIVLNRNGSEWKKIAVGRKGQRWQSENVRFLAGNIEALIVAAMPEGAPIKLSSQISVRQMNMQLAIESPTDINIPQDAVLECIVRVIPQNLEDINVLMKEQRLTFKLLDEASRVVQEQQSNIDDKGIATVVMEPPRSGRFTLNAIMPNGLQASKTLNINKSAVDFKLLEHQPSFSDTLSSLLLKPAVPIKLKKGTSLYPVILPTEAFPVNHYQIAEAKVKINEQWIKLQNDRLNRWYSSEPYVITDEKNSVEMIEVTLADNKGGHGMILVQKIDCHLNIVWPWWKILLFILEFSSLVIFIVSEVHRNYFAIGDIEISLTDPAGMPEYCNVRTAYAGMLRWLEWVWPRIKYEIGVNTGDMKLAPGVSVTESGVLATIRRNKRRQLEIYDHIVQKETPLVAGWNAVPIGDVHFEITCPDSAGKNIEVQETENFNKSEPIMKLDE